MNEKYLALAGRIEQTCLDLEKVVDRIEMLLRKVEQTQDDDYWDGIALNLHSFYTGVERIFEDIARSLDETLPDGPNWHQQPLLQMSAQVNGLRPAVISRVTRYCLDEYRGFRHLIRNIYTFNLRPSRLVDLTSELSSCYAQLRHDLDLFRSFLEQTTDSEKAD